MYTFLPSYATRDGYISNEFNTFNIEVKLDIIN